MGKRRALIYRAYSQTWLARNIVSHYPLVARVARHWRLLQALGFTGLTTERRKWTSGQLKLRPASQQQGSLLPNRSLFRPPLIEGILGEHRAAFVRDELEGNSSSQATEAYQPIAAQEKEQSAGEYQPEVTKRIEALEVQDRHHLSEQQSADKSDSSDSEPVAHLELSEVAHRMSESSLPVEGKRQKVLERTDADAQPEEKARVKRTRGLIEEHTAENGLTLASPLASPVIPTHLDDQTGKALEGQVADESAMSEKDIAAEQLFAPRGTDRSPQAWIARLQGRRDSAHTDAASPHPAAGTLQEKNHAPSISSEQAAPSKTRDSLEGTGSITFYQDEQTTVVSPTDAQSNSPQILAEPRQAQSEMQGEGSNRFVRGLVRNGMQDRPDSTPLSQRTRQFLQPLIGIDLTNIRVHRDAIAEHLTGVYQADAITTGNDVELAAGHTDDAPETLGLLAHELTHVARHRVPHFIPPIVRSSVTQPSGGNLPQLEDEEKLALRVERQVKREAREQVDQLASRPDKPAGNPTRTTPPPHISQPANDAWGGIPAPWEPLPAWLMTMQTKEESVAQIPVANPQPFQLDYGTDSIERGISEAHSTGNGGTGTSLHETGVQRAGKERSQEGNEDQRAQSRPETTKAPEPNMDELARQVYTILKRRLGVEYRREG